MGLSRTRSKGREGRDHNRRLNLVHGRRRSSREGCGQCQRTQVGRASCRSSQATRNQAMAALRSTALGDQAGSPTDIRASTQSAPWRQMLAFSGRPGRPRVARRHSAQPPELLEASPFAEYDTSWAMSPRLCVDMERATRAALCANAVPQSAAKTSRPLALGLTQKTLARKVCAALGRTCATTFNCGFAPCSSARRWTLDAPLNATGLLASSSRPPPSRASACRSAMTCWVSRCGEGGPGGRRRRWVVCASLHSMPGLWACNGCCGRCLLAASTPLGRR